MKEKLVFSLVGATLLSVAILGAAEEPPIGSLEGPDTIVGALPSIARLNVAGRSNYEVPGSRILQVRSIAPLIHSTSIIVEIKNAASNESAEPITLRFASKVGKPIEFSPPLVLRPGATVELAEAGAIIHGTLYDNYGFHGVASKIEGLSRHVNKLAEELRPAPSPTWEYEVVRARDEASASKELNQRAESGYEFVELEYDNSPRTLHHDLQTGKAYRGLRISVGGRQIAPGESSTPPYS